MKVREDQHKNEDIVHAERVLDQIAGQKIDTVMGALNTPHQRIKSERHEYPDHGPLKRGAHAQFATTPLGAKQVDT